MKKAPPAAKKIKPTTIAIKKRFLIFLISFVFSLQREKERLVLISYGSIRFYALIDFNSIHLKSKENTSPFANLFREIPKIPEN